LHNPEMLGDSLAREMRAGSEPGDGHGAVVAQAQHEA
jgi:hypothetical protein